MSTLTPKEQEALLVLFKELNTSYNANSLSKQIGITPRGVLKILRHLKELNLVVSLKFGKAIFYKPNLGDYYAFRVLETLLISEARKNASRWLSDFLELFKNVEVAILFGSIIRRPKEARDVDLLLVFTKKKMKAIKYFIQEKNKILLRPIHPIMQSPEDLENNLKNKDPVILNALKQGYVLHGQDKLIEVVKNVTSF